jgi:glycerophosphoryl diester phosphodiesterase
MRAPNVNAQRARPRPRTVGHRGASALAPENTLRAIALAIEHRLDLVEIDVYLSHDEQLVVVHDEDLRRVAGRPEQVAALDASALAQVDVGEGQGVPRLAEVLALARGKIGVYVELKGERTGAALGALAQAGALGDVEVIAGSFEPSLVEELRRVAPDIPRSVLFRRTSVQDMIVVCRRAEAVYAHPCFRPLEMVVGPLHAAGLMVMSPHTNDAAEATRFLELGVDVIASDDPRVLHGALASSP